MNWLHQWFRRKPSKELEAVQRITEQAETAFAERKSALGKLMAALDAIPLDQAIATLGSDLTKVTRNGH